MNVDNLDASPRANRPGQAPHPLIKGLPRLATGLGSQGSREGTPTRPNYYNTPSTSNYQQFQVPVLSQTQQIQKLFELNPDLQQLQNAANKATEILDDEEGEELDDEQLAESTARENQ